MRAVRYWAAVTVGLYVIQASLLPLLAYHGVSSNLLLLWIVSFSLLKGYRTGVFMGFCAGLLQDLATGTFFGCNVLSYMAVSFFCGKLSDRVFREDVFPSVMLSVVTAAGHYFLIAALMYLLGYRFQLTASMQYTLLPMLIWQFLFSYPVYKIAYALDDYLQDK